MNRVLSLIVISLTLLLGGCATPGYDAASALSAPTDISELYSQVMLHAKMAITREDEHACQADECTRRADFDKRVATLGANLADAAYRLDPALKERVPQFKFSVLDKTEPGSGSTAAGSVVVLRPVSELAWSDEALSFMLAREMGHVISRHHEVNTGTNLPVQFDILAAPGDDEHAEIGRAHV